MTIDSSQGREKSVIILSTVRSNPARKIGFLSNQRRANVSLTRAYQVIIVIGNSETLNSDYFWGEIVEYFDKAGSYAPNLADAKAMIKSKLSKK
jgi:superfamily I DNA and/or RNA helicase